MDGVRGEAQQSTLADDGPLVSRTAEVSDAAFRAFLAAHDPPRVHWAAPDGLEIVGCDAAVSLTASGPDRFEAIRRGAAAVFNAVDHRGPPVTRPRMLGGFSFTDRHDSALPWTGFPAASFVVPRVQLTRADGTTWLTVSELAPDDADAVAASLDAAAGAVADLPAMCPSGSPPGVTATRRTTSKAEWTEQVEDALDRIRTGDLRKVVLAQALAVDLASPIDVPDVLERLRRTYPDCYRFLVQPTDRAAFFGPPPERLVSVSGTDIRTEALAGSVPRGETPEADADLAASLVDTEKLQHEQQLVVDAITDQLDPLGGVTVGDQRVRKLTNIQHLQTPIEAELAEREHILRLVEVLHPTPAVGGLPPDAALDTIRDIETFDRGWYAAPVGWFDAAGDGEFAVGIRSGVVGGTRATLFAGAGIVADSDPDDEWDEIQPKYRPILDELE
ncbi:isochorismate synthase [Halobacteriales archaeon QS_1_68_17]|nr:MAG: isochorismate synthase [Halobacteriales archaeon QS_1_68_17]